MALETAQNLSMALLNVVRGHSNSLKTELLYFD